LASLTALPEETRSASQVFLRRLPSPNQSSKLGKDPTPARTRLDQICAWLNAIQGLSEVAISSQRTLRELSQARQMWICKEISTIYSFEAHLQLLKLFYSFRKPWEVQRFLENNKFLILILLEAYFEIRKYFANTQVFLEVDTDPEVKNDQQLVAFIATDYSPDEALRALKQFDEDWWLDTLDRAQRKLCISVEFE
jgi:hypothetical protein